MTAYHRSFVSYHTTKSQQLYSYSCPIRQLRNRFLSLLNFTFALDDEARGLKEDEGFADALDLAISIINDYLYNYTIIWYD